MECKNYRQETLALRGGYEIEPTTKSVAVPIYLTNAYEYESTDYAEKIFNLQKPGNIYSRLSNPTVDVLERRMAILDGGVAALGFSSGHCAIFSTMLNLCSSGDEIVSSINIYGGAINLLGVTLNRIGIKTKFVNPNNFDEWKQAITDKTKCLFVEMVGNPNANIADIENIAKLAHSNGIPFIVDSTFTTPALIKPIDFGADIVVYSATKFLNGHSNVMGGLIVDSGKFNFKNNKRFPLYNEPDPSYHGLIYSDLNETAFITRLRTLIMRDIGGCMSAFNAFEIMNGIETLSIRMERHCENALEVAKFLDSSDKISAVHFPMLKNSLYYELAKKYLPNGVGSVFTFDIKGNKAAAAKFIDNLKLIIHCANVGDTRSLISHPATTTHSQLNEEQLNKAGISSSTVRISVGIENVNDIIDDIKQALDKI